MSYGTTTYGAGTTGAQVAQVGEDYEPPAESNYGTDHMSTTSLDVANAALIKLGADPITSLSADNNRARAVNERIEWCKWAVLRLHPWNFAKKRASVTTTALTGAADNGGLIRITATAHGLSTGERIRIADVVGTTEANGLWLISVVDDDTFDLDGSVYANAYVSGGVYGKAPAHGYDWAHDLPSDFIRLLPTDKDYVADEYRPENGQVMTDEKTLYINYIANVTNYGMMDTLFRECLATHLAMDICIRITQSNQLLEQIQAYYKTIMPKSRFVDGTEDSLRYLEANEFVQSRFGQSEGYVPLATT